MIPFVKKKVTFEKPENQSAGILDDYAVRKDIETIQGSIIKVPVNPYDIANKAYVDSAISGADLSGAYIPLASGAFFVPYDGATDDLHIGLNYITSESGIMCNWYINEVGDAWIEWDILSGAWVAANPFWATNFKSLVGTGTEPYACASITLNTNLNADLLDGLHGSDLMPILSGSEFMPIASGAAYVPYIGANADLDMGLFDVSATQVKCDTYYSADGLGGTLLWEELMPGLWGWRTNSTPFKASALWSIGVLSGACLVIGDISGSQLFISGLISGSNLFVGNRISGASLSIGGYMSGASLNVTGRISGGSLYSEGHISGATIFSAGRISGASVFSSGVVSGAGLVANQSISGANCYITSKLGVGDTAPTYQVDAKATSVAIRANSTGAANEAAIIVQNDSTNSMVFKTYGSTAAGTLFGQNRTNLSALYSTIAGAIVIGSYYNQPLIFGVNNIEYMRVAADGNVGIFVASPVTKLHVSGGALTISNCAQPATPTNAGALWVSGGALYYIGAGAKVTKLADSA